MGTSVPVGRANGPPAETTAFVGRRDEVAEVRRLLSASRLVTLTGPGGVGKTRLALCVAAKVARAFPDGVCVVELASLRDPDLLPHAVADALGLHDHSDRAATDVVAEHLRDRRTLLVLDNCEHLADACARTADVVLRTCAGVRILATSRHVLGLIAERAFPVPPLDTPPADRPVPLSELHAYQAVVLFEQRAAAVVPGFALTPGNAETVGRLVRRLDGLPLAIELTAAWLRTLSPAQILSRLDDGLGDRFALLTTGGPAAPARQRTLRNLLDWSLALCSPPERSLWARLSVFSGGFDLAAAEAVCSGDDLPAAGMAEVLRGLVEKSVVTRAEHHGAIRFEMLETVRAYGHEQLAGTGAADALRRRHRDHYLHLTEQAQAHWFGPGQAEWFTRLRMDHANLRAALEFCLTEPGQAPAGMALAVAPRDYWITLGSLSEGRYWLGRLLAADAADATTGALADADADADATADAADARGAAGARDSTVRTAALGTYGFLGVMQGAVGEALPVVAEYRAAAERLHDASALAWVPHHLALAAVFRGELPDAAALFEEAVARHRELGDAGAVAECTVKLAIVRCLLGDLDGALDLCRYCRGLCEGRGETWVEADTLFAEGLVRWYGGDRAAADALAREAIALMRPFNDRWGIALCVELTAWSAAAAGHAQRAARLLGILASLWETVGGGLSTAPFLTEPHRNCEQRVRTALGDKAYERARRRGAELAFDAALSCVLQSAPEPEAAATAGATPPDVPLTSRERQVAELVAAGRSNKEIAAALVIAQRTAENHVEHILAKLGFTSRAQIAVWAHGQQTPAGR